MAWLIGSKPRSVALTESYWQNDDAIADQFKILIEQESFFLDISKCHYLLNLTFLDEEHPFGIIDPNSTVGKVSIDRIYNEKFKSEILKALELIKPVSELKLLIEASVKLFVPLVGVKSSDELRINGSGKSAHWLKSAVFLSLPMSKQNTDLELALNIVHELGHQVLMIFQDSNKLLISPLEPIYSSVRKVERPAIMSFHALVAIYFMLFFVFKIKGNSQEDADWLEQKRKMLTHDFVAGAYALRNAEFSHVGLMIFNEMLNFVEARKVAV